MSEWINSMHFPPRKDIAILTWNSDWEMPDCVQWYEDGTYGSPGFFESNKEYETKEKDIEYWMPAPTPPTLKK